MKHRENDNLETYYTIFKNILNNLKIRKLILEIKYTKLFLKELSMQARERAIRKINVNFEKSKTMKFDIIYIFMMKET